MAEAVKTTCQLTEQIAHVFFIFSFAFQICIPKHAKPQNTGKVVSSETHQIYKCQKNQGHQWRLSLVCGKALGPAFVMGLAGAFCLCLFAAWRGLDPIEWYKLDGGEATISFWMEEALPIFANCLLNQTLQNDRKSLLPNSSYFWISKLQQKIDGL